MPLQEVSGELFCFTVMTFLETVDHEPIEWEGPTAAVPRGVNNCSVYLQSEIIFFVSWMQY